MKKLSLIAIFACLGLAASAQWFSFGVKAGYNVTLADNQSFKSAVSDMIDVKNNIQNGFHAGFYARLGHRFYAQPELLYNYSVYNRRISVLNQDLGEAKRYTVSTIDVPILAGFSIINTNNFKLRIMAGPKLSFNAGSTKLDSWSDFTESVRAARVGLDCGVGVDIWRLNLDVRYNLFQDIYKQQDMEGNTVNKGNVLNSFYVSLGFRIFGNN